MQNDTDQQRIFKEKLSQASLKATQNRLEICQILSNADRPLTVQEIVTLSSQGHFVSIYRSVDSMHKAGILKQIPSGFKNCFELSDDFKPHHHHATCEICGMSRDVSDGSIEEIMKSLTKKSGLKPTKHHFELFGICTKCQAKEARQD